jgi:pimeloyl-ACP methyl ester carboxylesterase
MTRIESKFIDVEGMRTHYLDGARGFPVVFLHSGEFGGCAELSWEFTLPALAEHFHVIAPDWLGFGESAKIFSFEDMRGLRVRHITAFLKALGVDRAHFIGNSMGGGMLASVAAMDAPVWAVEKYPRRRGRFRAGQRRAPDLNSYDGSREHEARAAHGAGASPLRDDDAHRQACHRSSGAWECRRAALSPARC